MTNPYLAVIAIVLGVAVLQVGNGLFGAFLPIRMSQDGAQATLVGLVVTGHAAGFLVGCLTVPLLIAAFGHIRAFAVFAAATAAATLAFAIDPNARLWIALRIVTGFCSAGLFTVAESWLNDMTPSSARGRVVSFYMLFNKMAFAGGQLLLLSGDVAGFAFFMIASACYSLSLVPVALNTAASPKAPRVAAFSAAELVRIAPAGTVGCFVAGLVNTAVLNIAPVYLGGIGESTDNIAWLLASMQIGSLLLQWPLGWLSDRIDRRIVIAIASGAVTLASLAIAVLGDVGPGLLVALFALWGGFGLSIYAICIAHANDFVDRSEVVRPAVGLGRGLGHRPDDGHLADGCAGSGHAVLLRGGGQRRADRLRALAHDQARSPAGQRTRALRQPARHQPGTGRTGSARSQSRKRRLKPRRQAFVNRRPPPTP